MMIPSLLPVLVPIAVVGSFVGGLAIPWMVVGFVTFRQRTTPAQLQGRVSAASNMALNGPQTFGTAAGAYLVAVVDWRYVVLAEAIVIVACAIPLLIHRRVPVVEHSGEAVH
jgi:MFS family permease